MTTRRLKPRVWRRWKGKFNCWEYYDEQMLAHEGIEAPPGDDWQEFVPAKRVALAQELPGTPWERGLR